MKTASTNRKQPDSREILRAHGIPASVQRIAILDWVRSVSSHPSAEAVFQALREEIPTLSRTTVYSTLHLFCEKGIVLQVPCNDSEGMRFDGDLRPHAHFRCEQCGEIFDFACASHEFSRQFEVPDGFTVRGSQVALTGLCPHCAATAPACKAHA